MVLYYNTLPQSGGVNVAKSLVTPLSSVHVSSGLSISSWSLSLIHKFSQAQSRGFPDRRSLETNKHSFMSKYKKKRGGGNLLSGLCHLRKWNVKVLKCSPGQHGEVVISEVSIGEDRNNENPNKAAMRQNVWFKEGAYTYWSLVLLKNVSDEMDVKRVFVIVLFKNQTQSYFELLSFLIKQALCGTHKFLRFM